MNNKIEVPAWMVYLSHRSHPSYRSHPLNSLIQTASLNYFIDYGDGGNRTHTTFR